MDVLRLVARVNDLSDESDTTENIIEYLNDAISDINVRLKANFPYLDTDFSREPAFPEKWQRLLLIPFACGRVKQKDGSQFEYSDYFSQYEEKVTEMAASYDVPTMYKDDMNDSYSSDIFTKPPYWGGNW